MTKRLPELSNSIDRGLCIPVATTATRYPDAIEGLIEFVGVKVVEQLVDDCPKVGRKKKFSRASGAERRYNPIFKLMKNEQPRQVR